jgi:hypothetical protein
MYSTRGGIMKEVMKCYKCGRELGNKLGQYPGYCHGWKKVSDSCIRITLCNICDKLLDWCLPSKHDEDAYFGKSEAKKPHKDTKNRKGGKK